MCGVVVWWCAVMAVARGVAVARGCAVVRLRAGVPAYFPDARQVGFAGTGQGVYTRVIQTVIGRGAVIGRTGQGVYTRVIQTGNGHRQTDTCTCARQTPTTA